MSRTTGDTPRAFHPPVTQRDLEAEVIHCVGGVLSPLLSNVALTVLDEHIARAPGGPASSEWQRAVRRRRGLPNFRLVRYADDWCLMVRGTRADAEALKEEIAGVLAGMGLRLSPEKTLITHIDEGLDFLGWRIQRHRQPGGTRRYVYTCPAKKALRAICRKAKGICRGTSVNQPLSVLLYRLNPVLRGWCAYCVSRGHARSAWRAVGLMI
jgi:RNA-directed DNA polymerase